MKFICIDNNVSNFFIIKLTKGKIYDGHYHIRQSNIPCTIPSYLIKIYLDDKNNCNCITQASLFKELNEFREEQLNLLI